MIKIIAKTKYTQSYTNSKDKYTIVLETQISWESKKTLLSIQVKYNYFLWHYDLPCITSSKKAYPATNLNKLIKNEYV